MISNKIILGFTGLIASGKGTAAKYFNEKYGATTYRFSTMLRDLLNRIHVEHSRDNIIKISEAIRRDFGEDVMAKTMAADAEADTNPFIVIEGIRRMADIEYLSRLPNFILIEIFAEPITRFERLVKRGENVGDTTKTYEQFLEDHKRSTEVSILDVIPRATERVDNNGTIDDLKKQLDALVTKYSS